MKYFFLCVLGVMLALTSCEKIALEDEGTMVAPSDEGFGMASLTVTTRIGGGDENAVNAGCIYIFNQDGDCVQILSTDDESNTINLPAGAYSLYAVGGEDLGRFVLPTQANATTTSVITLKSGSVMDDLLMNSANVELEDGESTTQNIVLERKVLSLTEVEIKQVPANVTGVEVSLTPIYGSIRLDGTYPDTPTESYKVALSKQDDGTTWKAQPNQMLFPSKGKPSIKVTFTTDEGTKGFSYTAAEELPANHHFTISGTYVAPQGVNITGVLTAADWGEDRTISFEFDNDNVAYAPEAGQRSNGYYVVSVDATHRTAVLLALSTATYTKPATGSAISAWSQALTTAMAGIEKPAGVTNNWRVPTLAEVSEVLQNPTLSQLGSSGSTGALFCQDGDNLRGAFAHCEDEVYTVYDNVDVVSTTSNVYLWPVIDIKY